jgi:hypothetical protein
MDDDLFNISLNQGKQFKKFQGKIKKSVEQRNKGKDKRFFKEGFDSMNGGMNEENGENYQDRDIFKERDERGKTTASENQVEEDQFKQIQGQYNGLADKYKTTEKTVNSNSLVAINRTSPNNPYLNKNIRFTTGHVCYVTNQGVVKWIPSQTIWDSLTNCSDKTYIDVNIPWLTEYSTPGTTIPTNPSLISGTNMILNQSCGSEGKNVYVNRLTDNTNATYMGCYGDEDGSAMTFIGGAPVKKYNSSIQNGNFSQPSKTNNSYEYITSSSKVPGWNFNAVLVNNSSAWGYPMPYPNGNQCACIQSTQYMEQIINLNTGSYTLSFMACGRPGYDGSNPIDIQLNGVTTFSVTPPYAWTSYSTTLNVTTDGNNTIKFIGTNVSPNYSTAFQGITIQGGSETTSSGTYTYDMCKNAAMDDGYKYFALQNVNTETNKGYCAVSNDSVSSTRNGTAYVVTGIVALWDSKTYGTDGKSASITNQGTLTVFNSSGAAIFNTPSDPALSSGGYIGCYNDKENPRAMINTSSGKWYSFDTCKQYAKDGNYSYYGNQNKDKNNNGWCVASNDLASSQKYGVANNCTTDASGNYMGGFSSNAIYSMDGSGSYYVMLEDNGKMAIYKGTSPSDNQGQIWSSGAYGKQQSPNPLYAAAKGKYGKNWMATGSTLAIGDFIGSPSGYIYLIMQSDGNLVLYTSQTAENCKKINNDYTGGGENANALYEFENIGFSSNLGKIAYVDSETNLREYPSSLIEKSNKYELINNYDSYGNDISQTTSSSAEKGCIDSCNANAECSGFVYQPNGNTCYLKNSSMYPVGKKQFYQDSGLIMGVRKPQLNSSVSGSCSRDIVDINSIQYNNYIKGDQMASDTQCQSNLVSQQDKTALTDIQNQMYTVGEDMATQSNSLYTTDKDIGNTLSTNSSQFKKNVAMYKKNDKKIKNELNLPTTFPSQSNVEGMSSMDSANKNLTMNDVNSMLSDTDIRVLQENYSYIFWSILAVGLLTVTVSKMKK